MKKVFCILAALLLFVPAVLAQPTSGNQVKIVDNAGDRLDVTAGGAAKIDGSGTTQPVSAASLPLPAGASSAVNQATGNASLASIDGKITTVNTGAVTISGALPAGTNAIGKLSANSGVDIGDVDILSSALPSGASTSANQSTLNTSVASIDTKTVSPAALADGASATPTVPTNGSVQLLMNATTVDRARAVINGQNTTGTGITAAGILGQLDDTGTGSVTENQFAPARLSTRRALLVEGVASGTAIPVSESGTWTVQPGNTPNTSPWLVQVVPATSGGLSKFHLVSAGTTNATVVKASAGQLCGWYIYNSNAAARKIAFHNTASTPTAGASVTDSYMIPPTSAANTFSESCIAFATGIAITTVTGLADNDSAAVAANDLVINLYYK